MVANRGTNDRMSHRKDHGGAIGRLEAGGRIAIASGLEGIARGRSSISRAVAARSGPDASGLPVRPGHGSGLSRIFYSVMQLTTFAPTSAFIIAHRPIDCQSSHDTWVVRDESASRPSDGAAPSVRTSRAGERRLVDHD